MQKNQQKLKLVSYNQKFKFLDIRTICCIFYIYTTGFLVIFKKNHHLLLLPAHVYNMEGKSFTQRGRSFNAYLPLENVRPKVQF